MLNGNDPETFINGQKRPEFADIPYGRSTVGRSGCEAIACYNAMLLTGRPVSFTEIRAYFEKLFRRGLGWLGRGFLGASPFEIRLFLRKQGVHFSTVRSVRGFEKMLAAQAAGTRRDAQGKTPQGVLIVSYWNRPLLKYGYHTVAVDCRLQAGAAGPELMVYNRFDYTTGPERIGALSELMHGNWRFIRGFYIPFQRQGRGD